MDGVCLLVWAQVFQVKNLTQMRESLLKEVDTLTLLLNICISS